jgi:hypothetical protein
MAGYKSLTLVPAYGRDYKSKASLMEDWNSGKDFRIEGFGYSGANYCNIKDVDHFKTNGYTHLHFRYSRLEKVAVVEVK